VAISEQTLSQLQRMFPEADFEEVPEGIKVIHRAGSREDNRRQIADRIEQALDRIEADAADDVTWAALTPLRRTQTTRLAVLVVAKLARLVLGRLDKA
jgi:hypothetical protein